MWRRVWITSFAVVLCGILFMVFSSTGLRLIVNLASRDLSGTLTYKSLTGTLFGPYHFRGLNYRNGTQQLHVEDFYLSWKPWLWPKRIVIKKIKAQGIDIISDQVNALQAQQLHTIIQQKLQQTLHQTSKIKHMQPQPDRPDTHITATIPDAHHPSNNIQRSIQAILHSRFNLQKISLQNICIGSSIKQCTWHIKTVDGALTLMPQHLHGDLHIQVNKPQATDIHATLSGSAQQYDAVLHLHAGGNNLLLKGRGSPYQFSTAPFSGTLFSGHVSGHYAIQWPHTPNTHNTQQPPQNSTQHGAANSKRKSGYTSRPNQNQSQNQNQNQNQNQGQNQGQSQSQWQLALNFKHLNLQTQQTDALQMPLINTLNMHITKKDRTLLINMPQIQLTWKDGKYLKGNLHVHYLPQKLEKILLQMASQNGKITLSGSYDQQWNIQWQLTLNRLKSWVKHLHGSFSSTGKISGPRQHPIIAGSLQTNHVKYHSYDIAQLQATWDIDTSEKTDSSLQFSAKNIYTPYLDFTTLNAQSEGTISQHNLSLQAKTTQSQWDANLQGGWQQTQWQGKLQQFTLTSRPYGTWDLQHSSALKISKQHIALAPLCWVSQHGSLCGHATLDKTGPWQVKINANQVNLAIFNRLISEKFNLNSIGDLQFNIAGEKNILQQWLLHCNISDGYLDYLSPLKKQAHIEFSQGELTSKLQQQQINTKLNFKLQQSGYLQATLHMPHYQLAQLPSLQQPISGNIKLAWNDISALAAIIPPALHVSGRLDTKLGIAGSIGNPQLNGKAKLSNGRMQLPNLGLILDHITAQLHADSDKVHYKIRLQSQQKPLQLNGTAWLKNGALYANAKLTGKHVLVWNTPAYVLYASPMLEAQLADKQLNIKGNLVIPQAMLQPPSYSNVAVLPKNTVIIHPGYEKHQDTGYQTNMQLHVVTGENVRFKAIGFDTKLKGKLTIDYQTRKPTLATGNIKLYQGVYLVRGQRFTINSGRLHANHSALTNPSINIRASRSIHTYNGSSVTAGINKITVGFDVSGNLHHPIVNLFSEPIALPQGDILSYILFGYPSNRTSQSDLTMLSNSISSLSLNPSNQSGPSVIQRVKQSLHIDQLGFSRNATVDPVLGNTLSRSDSALNVGGYVSPRIYLHYQGNNGVSENMVQLRYFLTPKWVLQTNTSNLGNGADIIYSFQRR